MVIKIDVDGVIRDMLDALCKLYHDFDPTINRAEIFDYRVSVSFPLIKEKTGIEAHDFFFKDNAEYVGFKGASLMHGAKEAIDLLRGNGHTVVIVTKQKSYESKIHTLNFLKYYGIKYDSICFTEDKWMIKSDFMIDDNPDFLEDYREETPESERLMIKAPYNTHCGRFESFNSLLEAANYIIEHNDTTVNNGEEDNNN